MVFVTIWEEYKVANDDNEICERNRICLHIQKTSFMVYVRGLHQKKKKKWYTYVVWSSIFRL